MTPQEKTLLKHLQEHGNISQAEANLIYKMRALPRRISDLRERGYKIKSELKVDATGQRYARYTLLGGPEVQAEAEQAPTEITQAPKRRLKVGDRVRVINDDEGSGGNGGEFFKVGDTGTILQAHSPEQIVVQFDEPYRLAEGRWFVNPDAVVLLNPGVGSKVRVVAAKHSFGCYHNGDEGVVTLLYGDAGLWVDFPHRGRSLYLYSEEVEVIA